MPAAGALSGVSSTSSPATELENLNAEAKHRSLEILKWEQATTSLLAHPLSPTLQTRASTLSARTTPQGATALGFTKKVEVAHHLPPSKKLKPHAGTANKLEVAIESQKPATSVAPTVPLIDEKKIRKSKEMIAEGLREAMEPSAVQSSGVMRSELANAIVDAILALNVGTNTFSDKIRHLQFNLRKNGELRGSVLDGTISPNSLVIMRSEEMETKEQAEKRKRIEEKSLENAVLPEGDLEFGMNIDAALQLKREAQGFKEPRYSDADTFNHSKDQKLSSSPFPLPNALATTNLLDDLGINEGRQPGVALKRTRDADVDCNGGDIDNTEDELLDGKPSSKKTVKFDAGGRGGPENFSDEQPSRNGVLKHHSSLQGGVPASAYVDRQQIDWGAPIEHADLVSWQPPPILANRGKIYQGQLQWRNLSNDFQVDVEVVGFQPTAFIRLPHPLGIIEAITFNEMKEKIEKSGARPWNLHRAWLVGPKLPDLFGQKYLESVETSLESPSMENANSEVDSEHSFDASSSALLRKLSAEKRRSSPIKPRRSKKQKRKARLNKRIEEALEERKVVGRILINLNGKVLRNYNEGWTSGSHAGWEIFILEPTMAACEVVSALLQEGDAARKSHSLLMIAGPQYWGELLPLGENGIRQGLAGSSRLYVSASGAATLHKLPKVINCDLQAFRSRLNLSEIWNSVFGDQGIRLYLRQPSFSNIPGDISKSRMKFGGDEDSDQENEKNTIAFETLGKRLQEDHYGADALICQHDVPHHLDLAVAAGPSNAKEKYLLLGCWNRKLVPGLGHYAIDIREPKAWVG